jgi:hypothetical protein
MSSSRQSGKKALSKDLASHAKMITDGPRGGSSIVPDIPFQIAM